MANHGHTNDGQGKLVVDQLAKSSADIAGLFLQLR